MPTGADLRPRPGDADAGVRAALARRSPALRVLTVVVATYAGLTTVLVGVGWLVVEVGDGSWFGEADRASTRWLVEHHGGNLDWVMARLSSLADTFTVLGVAFGCGVVMLVLHHWRQAVVLLVGLPLELLTFLSVSYTVDRPRPGVGPTDMVPSTASFPSGHIAAAIVLYGGMAVIVRSLSPSPRVRRGAVVVAVVLAVGVGFSRVYWGLHHPSDVVFGAVLGVVVLVAAVVAARTFPEDPRVADATLEAGTARP